jgi:hypothetical protein
MAYFYFPHDLLIFISYLPLPHSYFPDLSVEKVVDLACGKYFKLNYAICIRQTLSIKIESKLKHSEKLFF